MREYLLYVAQEIYKNDELVRTEYPNIHDWELDFLSEWNNNDFTWDEFNNYILRCNINILSMFNFAEKDLITE